MTRNFALLVLAFSLTSVAASQLIMKAKLGPLTEAMAPGTPWMAYVVRAMSEPLIWLGVGLVIAGGVAWYLALAKLPLGLMMPVASVIAPATALGAYLFLGETLSPPKVCAILLIAAGVAWLGWLNA